MHASFDVDVTFCAHTGQGCSLDSIKTLTPSLKLNTLDDDLGSNRKIIITSFLKLTVYISAI